MKHAGKPQKAITNKSGLVMRSSRTIRKVS